MSKIPDVELTKLLKIEGKELRLLWVNDGYEGPLEAVAEYAGAPCLIVLHDENLDVGSNDRPSAPLHAYRWLIIGLSAEQRLEEERLHALFVEHVGDHWCFHGPEVGHPPPASERERDPERFYRPYRERAPFDLTKNPVLGWADEMPAR